MNKVLIFDDDKDILELCTVILLRKGYETIGEGDSKRVIEKIAEISPDVIMMDIWIPGMGGVEAVHLIKNTKATDHIPVILFSANNNIERIAKEARADYFLKKPFDILALNNIIEKALQQHQPS